MTNLALATDNAVNSAVNSTVDSAVATLSQPELTVEPIALVSPQRIAAVLQAQTAQVTLNYDEDVVAIFDFNGFLLHVNVAGRRQLGIDLHENLSLFQVRCFSPLTQDMWDEIFRTLMDCGQWSGVDRLQYGQQPAIAAKMTIMGHPLPNGTIDCFSLVARGIR